MNGWIKIHRKITDWGWYGDANTFRVFFHLLITANHRENTWLGRKIYRGQVVIGRIKLAETLGISIQSTRTALKRLKSTNEITTKTTSKYTIVTIMKYEQYQLLEDSLTTNSTIKLTNKQPATNQQLTTNKNVKNDKKNTNTATALLDSHKDIIKVIEMFQTINPGINYGNKTERESANWLIKKYGVEKTIKLVDAAVAIHGKKYAPTITTPYQLKNKLGELVGFYKRQKDSSKVGFID